MIALVEGSGPTGAQLYVVPIVIALLGGGLVSAITGLYNARKNARIASQRAPLEDDSIVVSSSEKAVLLMERSLNAANTRITELEAHLKKERDDKEKLERKVRRLQSEVDDLRVELHALRDRPAKEKP